LQLPRPPTSPRFPYTTLFRSTDDERKEAYGWIVRQMQDSLSPILLAQQNGKINEHQDLQSYAADIASRLDRLQQVAAQHTQVLTREDLAAMIADKTGIPVGKIGSDEQARLLNMQDYLRQRVVGQDHALDAIADAILESRSGLNKKGQPIGS